MTQMEVIAIIAIATMVFVILKTGSIEVKELKLLQQMFEKLVEKGVIQ